MLSNMRWGWTGDPGDHRVPNALQLRIFPDELDPIYAEALGLMDPAKMVGLVFNRDDVASTYYSVYSNLPPQSRSRRARGGSPARRTPQEDSLTARWPT